MCQEGGLRGDVDISPFPTLYSCGRRNNKAVSRAPAPPSPLPPFRLVILVPPLRRWITERTGEEEEEGVREDRGGNNRTSGRVESRVSSSTLPTPRPSARGKVYSFPGFLTARCREIFLHLAACALYIVPPACYHCSPTTVCRRLTSRDNFCFPLPFGRSTVYPEDRGSILAYTFFVLR